MTTTRRSYAPSTDNYANELLLHFLRGTAKPRFPLGYRPVKEYPDDCVLTDEQIFDLSILLKLLHDVDSECQGPPESVPDDRFLWRDEVEEALAYFLARFCVDNDSPVFVPEYNRDLKQFNDDLNNYLLALRLHLRLYVPKLFQRYQCLILDFTITLARTRVLESFIKLCSQGVHWTYRRD
jgi:hypothetical protein